MSFTCNPSSSYLIAKLVNSNSSYAVLDWDAFVILKNFIDLLFAQFELFFVYMNEYEPY